jgi:hypothetical protein
MGQNLKEPVSRLDLVLSPEAAFEFERSDTHDRHTAKYTPRRRLSELEARGGSSYKGPTLG